MEADSADTHENYEQAIKLYENLIKQLAVSDAHSTKIDRARVRAARLYLTTGQYEKATPYFLQVTSHNSISPDKDPEIMIDLDDLSNAYLKYKADPKRDYEALLRCLAVRRLINPNHPYLVESYRLLANCCFSHARYDESIDWIKKAIDLDSKFAPTKRSYMATDLKTLATIYAEKKSYQEALSTAAEALAICEKFNCPAWLEGELHLIMGRMQTHLSKYSEAEKEFNLAIKASIKLNVQPNLVRILAQNSLKKLAELRKLNPKIK